MTENNIPEIMELLRPDPWKARANREASLIPVAEYRDWDYSNPHALTCVNHPDLRWYWKGPGRNLHFSFTSAASNGWAECECPFSDLRVIPNA